jgi:hypothetical protein
MTTPFFAADDLSPSAHQRLEDALPALRARVEARGRRRRLMRAAGSVLVPAVAVGALAWWSLGPGRPAPIHHAPLAIDQTPAPLPPPEAGGLIARVETDPEIGDRLTVVPPRAVVSIDDQGLRRALADAGRPSGLVRIGSRVLTAEDLRPAPQPDQAGEGR